MTKVDTSTVEIRAVIRGLRPMNGSNAMDEGVALIEALAAERDALQAQLTTIAAEARKEALQEVRDIASEWATDFAGRSNMEAANGATVVLDEITLVMNKEAGK